MTGDTGAGVRVGSVDRPAPSFPRSVLAGKTGEVLPHASDSLPSGFDLEASVSRLLILVSPTCPLCLSGIALVMDGLDGVSEEDLGVHVVWLPVLEADTGNAAEIAACSTRARRTMKQYWDHDRSLSSAAHQVLDLTSRRRRVAWDLYLFYRPGVRWVSPLPSPNHWLHQLDIADQPSLDEKSFDAALREFCDWRG